MTLRTQDGRLKPGVAIGLACLALILLFMSMGGCWITPFRTGHFGLFEFDRGLFWPFHGLLGIWGLIQIGLAIWVGFDADRRGSNGFLWGLLVFFTGVVGLIVYLIVIPTMARRGEPGGEAGSALVAAVVPPGPASPGAARCGSCGAQVQADFRVCPECGASLRCAACERPLQPSWKVCPYCATPVGGARE